MSHPYIKGTRVWLPDAKRGWKPAEITSMDVSGTGPDAELGLTITDDAGEVVTGSFPLATVLAAAASQQVETRSPVTPEAAGKDGQKLGLPPLRNPPASDTAEDLASLSNLNEPSGECEMSLQGWGVPLSESASPSAARHLGTICASLPIYVLRYRAGACLPLPSCPVDPADIGVPTRSP